MAVKPTKFGNLELFVQGQDKTTIKTIKQNRTVSVLSALPMEMTTYQAGAVVGSVKQELINVGSFVQYSCTSDEVYMNVCKKCSTFFTYSLELGLLAACFTVPGEPICK